MNGQDKQTIIEHRVDKARRTLQEVDRLIDLEFTTNAVNRIYYACFYAATALLLTIDIKPKTHAGVRQMFGQHFVETNKVSKDLGRFFADLYNKRYAGDYQDFTEFDKKTVEALFSEAKEFLNKIIAVIDAGNQNSL